MKKFIPTIMALVALSACQSVEEKAARAFVEQAAPIEAELAQLASDPSNSEDFFSKYDEFLSMAESFSEEFLQNKNCVMSKECIANSKFKIDEDTQAAISSIVSNSQHYYFRVERSNFVEIENRDFLWNVVGRIGADNAIDRAIIHNLLDPIQCSTISDLNIETRASEAASSLNQHVSDAIERAQTMGNPNQVFRTMTIVPLGEYDATRQTFDANAPSGEWSIYNWSGTENRETYPDITRCEISPTGLRFSYHFANLGQVFSSNLPVETALADQIITNANRSTSGFGRHLIAVIEFHANDIGVPSFKRHPYSENDYSIEVPIRAERVLFYLPPRNYSMSTPVGGTASQIRSAVLEDGPFRRSERKLNSLIPIIDPLFDLTLD